MTCASCIHSAQRQDGMLWCCLYAKPARKRCVEFIYCPGTDEADRDESLAERKDSDA